MSDARDGSGFWMVRYSWNPGKVVPSARSHAVRTTDSPALTVLPVIGPWPKSLSRISMYLAAVNREGADRCTDTSRSAPTSVATTTSLRDSGKTVYVIDMGGEPSANW